MGYDLLFQQAVKLHEAGELDKAENLYRQILETAPDNADILNLLGMIAQAKGIHDQACNWFYKASRQAPSSAHIYFNLGLSLFNDNKPIEAIATYQKSIALQSDIKETYNYLAEVYRALGETENAIPRFHKKTSRNHPFSITNICYCPDSLRPKPLNRSAFLRPLKHTKSPPSPRK